MSRITLIMAIIFIIIPGACHDINNADIMTQADKQLSYLALGDSYTIGESVDENERWPVQLVEKLRIDSVNVADATIIAQTGWTTDELIAGIEEAAPADDYHLVSLMIGVNNQYRGRQANNFRDELSELISIAINRSSNGAGGVIVLSVPDWGLTPFAAGRDKEKITSEIDLFNSVICEECSKAGVEYFNITDISRKVSSEPSLIADDGLHPSGEMYRLWVGRIYPYVYDLLKQD